jgi:predicted ATPase
MLKNYFDITPDDDVRKRREKIGERVLNLDRALEDTLPYIFALLEVVESDDLLEQMDPEVRRRRTLDALKRLLLRESLKQPLILIFEDLHWLDEGSLVLLNLLIESIGTARVLILVNYRPEFTHNWGNKTYYTQLRLDPLGTESAEKMLNALLSNGRDLVPLKRIIVEKTEGNPFFMEEIVQALFEQEALVRDGAVKLAKSLSSIQIPPTVQAVLASRIDRLAPGVKDLLNMLAVIGKEFPLGLVRHMAGKPDDELQQMLMVLQAAEFIYEQPAFPDVAYVFKHALSQQVAYGSTLQERRKALHERIANVLEAHFPETVETQPELLGHHYTQAGLGVEAIPHWQRAGERALQRAANFEAVNHLNNGLRLLDSLGGSDELTAGQQHHCSLLYLLGTAQKRSGNPIESHETLLHAAKAARELGSSELLVNALLQLTMNSYEVGLPVAPAIPLMREALMTVSSDDGLTRAKCLNVLARALSMTGSTQEALTYAQEGLAIARRLADPESIARNLAGMAYALQSLDHVMERLEITTEMLKFSKNIRDRDLLHDIYSFRTLAVFDAGDRQEAEAAIERYRCLAEESHNPFDIALSTAHRAAWALTQGRFAEAERFAEQSFAIGRQLHAERATGMLGLQMFSLRREQGRLRELEPLVNYFLAQHQESATWRPGLAVIYSELGRRQAAHDQFEHLARFDFADIPQDSMWMGTMTYLTDVCSFLSDRPRAAELYQLLLPYAHLNVVMGSVAVCYGAVSRFLGSLATTLERWDDAQRHFDHALTMNAAFGARPFLAHTQYQYGAMLLANDQPGDRQKAAALLKEALATARELGMRALEDQVTSGQPRAKRC